MSDAHRLRKKMHEAVIENDLYALREAINDLYDETESPLAVTHESGDTDMGLRYECFAPMVEILFLCCILQPNSAMFQEMKKNVKFMHAKFGMPKDEYERVLGRLETFSEGNDIKVWDEDLSIKVDPFRYSRLFQSQKEKDDAS